MAIISVNNKKTRLYSSSHFRYAMVYVVITFFVLLFLNIYSSETSQRLFYQSKETDMIEKCLLASAEMGDLEVLNTATVSSAVSQMAKLHETRLIVTDLSGAAIYDSASDSSVVGKFVLLPEVIKALEGNDVFTWRFSGGAMRSQAATPIFSYGILTGCVYMMEYDSAQGALVQSLENNILTITLILEAAVILFSLSFSAAFSRRLRKIMASMRIIREGDYSHKVIMGGHDELTVLGDEFNDLTERLQTSENKRRQFVSDASHELKTPLASIKLLSDSILQNDMDIDTVREFVGDIGNEADRLTRVSEKLLALTKSEVAIDVESEIINMAPTAQRVAKMLTATAARSNISIHLDLDQDSTVLITEDDLYQIAFNLAENGIKYNVPGGSLTIRLLREADNAILEVCDTGMGIPAEAISHVFERFYRVDKARSRKSGGSGLGLAIVRNIVERNGGTISVASTLGQGSTFRVTFPVFDIEEEET
ncbi:MAG: HAMP domain-containing protein [Oscillospiraceae bacterium]|nr:HAMP domain-containing protein [Oscillospiraceae bacterium]